MPDKRIGNVTVHLGERYGGEAQRVVNVADSDARLLRLQKSREENLNNSNGSLGKVFFIDVEKTEIKWEPTKGVRYYEADARDVLRVIVLENLAQKAWAHKAVYGKFARELRSAIKSLLKSLGNRPARFMVIATGKVTMVNGGTIELGTLIKVRVEGREFVLPESFGRDCSRAILKRFP